VLSSKIVSAVPARLVDCPAWTAFEVVWLHTTAKPLLRELPIFVMTGKDADSTGKSRFLGEGTTQAFFQKKQSPGDKQTDC